MTKRIYGTTDLLRDTWLLTYPAHEDGESALTDATSLAILRDLCLRANIKNRYITTVSQARIERETGYSNRTIRSKLADLEREGWIRRRKRRDATDEIAVAALKIKEHANLVRQRHEREDAKFGDMPIFVADPVTSTLDFPAPAKDGKRDIDDLEVAAFMYSLRNVSSEAPNHLSVSEMRSVARGLLYDHQHEEILVSLAHLDWSRIDLAKAKCPAGLLRSKLSEGARQAETIPNTYASKPLSGDALAALEAARHEIDYFGQYVDVDTCAEALRMKRKSRRSAIPDLHFSPWYLTRKEDGTVEICFAVYGKKEFTAADFDPEPTESGQASGEHDEDTFIHPGPPEPEDLELME